MYASESKELLRDCEAVQIPSGNGVTLPRGTQVDITQTLGGSFTVRTAGGLFRLAPIDADALGLETTTASQSSEIVSGTVTEADVIGVLKTCFDPEIPVNIVDLGLVYETLVEPVSGGHYKVNVKMTLTAPGCGMGPSIAADAQQKILSLPGASEATVEVVWDPPWHQSMITAEGRKVLGLE